MSKIKTANPLVKRFFEVRGISQEDWESFNDPSYGFLNEIDELCSHLRDIRDRNDKIVVLPDFDMDGIMSGTLGRAGLLLLGFDVELFIPDPKEGYGFDIKQIERLISTFPDVKAIITCDTGISCRRGVEFAVSKGIEVLITDHHQEKTDGMSPRGIAKAIVNPCAINERYEHPGICGAHVLWQVLSRFTELYENGNDNVSIAMRERIDMLRVFAGIGTISDTMPILWENRELVNDAIDICRKIWTVSPDFKNAIANAPSGYVDSFRGLYLAMSLFNQAGKLKTPTQVDEMFFGFYLAPAFNAVKRLDGAMENAFNVFGGINSSDNVKYLLELNEQRKQTVIEELEKVEANENPYAPIAYITDAAPGVLGLLAMKLMQESGLPCVVVSKKQKGRLTGSGRCPNWFSIVEDVPEFASCVAGHPGAFGCRFDDEKMLSEFSEMVYDRVVAKQKALLESGELTLDASDITIAQDDSGDAMFDSKLLIDFATEMESYKPFGRGFEEPVIKAVFDAESAYWNIIGKENEHLKISIPANDVEGEFIDILCWGQANLLDDWNPSGLVSVIGKAYVNTYNGHSTAQMLVNDGIRIENSNKSNH